MRAIDPVCGMEVEVSTSLWILTAGGGNFYFCSPTCLRTFEENAEAVLDLKARRHLTPSIPGIESTNILADVTRQSNMNSHGGKPMFDDPECHVEPLNKTASPEEDANLSVITLAITGMGCPNCANRVRNSLLMLSGVVEADVDHISGVGLIRYNTELVNPLKLTWAVAAAGGDGRHEYAASFE
jgi:YHS domain-containing protein/copper chaperone CopZ